MSWLISGWKYRKKITVQDAYVDSDLADFPAYVFIDADADFHETRADGHDIRFTLSDGKALLKYEREHWAGGNGSPATAHFWVKVPSVLASGGAVIYVYYGNPNAGDGQDAPNVWDANFKGVWHMKDKTASTIADSTGVNDGTKKAANEPLEADGKVYKGQDFDGDDYADCGNDESLRPNYFTVVAWIKQDAPSGHDTITVFSYYFDGYWCATYFDGFTFYLKFTDGDDGDYNLARGTLAIGKWHHVVFTYDGTHKRIYADGKEIWSKERPGILSYSGASLRLGKSSHAEGSGYPFTGIIDEVRISDIARTDAWLKFGYHNINEADNEIAWGIEEGILYSERLMDAYLEKKMNLSGLLEEKLNISAKTEEKINFSGFLDKQLDISGKTEEALAIKGVLKKTIKEELT